MLNSKNFSNYTIIGSLFSDEKIEVFIAYKGRNDADNLYIINKFPHIEDNNPLFMKFFSYFSSKDKIKDFVDMFTFEKHFYIVFKYYKCEPIKTKFDKELCTTAYDDRCFILDAILMKIDKISKMPQNALLCATEIRNIHVDDKKIVHINYDLRNIFNYNCANDFIFKNLLFSSVHEIVYLILQTEAESRFNKPLHIVLGKCKSGIYSSIPELAVDIKRAEKNSQNYNLISYVMYQINLRKNKVLKYTNLFLTVVVIIGIGMLAYNQLNKGNKKIKGSVPVISIGGIKYNADSEDESSKDVDAQQTAKSPKKANASEISLDPGLDIEYEDYIVQYGDTVESICSNYYQDTSFITPVSTFNNIESNAKLTAGTILKLPNRTAIALYISN